VYQPSGPSVRALFITCSLLIEYAEHSMAGRGEGHVKFSSTTLEVWPMNSELCSLVFWWLIQTKTTCLSGGGGYTPCVNMPEGLRKGRISGIWHCQYNPDCTQSPAFFRSVVHWCLLCMKLRFLHVLPVNYSILMATSDLEWSGKYTFTAMRMELYTVFCAEGSIFSTICYYYPAPSTHQNTVT